MLYGTREIAESGRSPEEAGAGLLRSGSPAIAGACIRLMHIDVMWEFGQNDITGIRAYIRFPQEAGFRDLN